MVLFEPEVFWDQDWSYTHYMMVSATTGFLVPPDNNSPTTLLNVTIKKNVPRHCLPGDKNHLQVKTTDLYENLKNK